MKKYAFNFAPLLNTKLMQEKEAKKILAAISLRLNAEILALNHLEQETEILREIWMVRMRGSLSPMELAQFNINFLALGDQIKNQKAQIQKINQEKVACQDHLMRLMMEIKSLESLDEKQFEDYKHEVSRENDKEMDSYMSGRCQNALSLGH